MKRIGVVGAIVSLSVFVVIIALSSDVLACRVPENVQAPIPHTGEPEHPGGILKERIEAVSPDERPGVARGAIPDSALKVRNGQSMEDNTFLRCLASDHLVFRVLLVLPWIR